MSRNPISSAEPGAVSDGVPLVVAAATPPIVCTLAGADQGERVRRWRELLSRARCRQTIDRGLRFELPAALAGEVAELAAAEQQCCAFFEFTLRLAGGVLHLEVGAPEDAAPLLNELFGTGG